MVLSSDVVLLFFEQAAIDNKDKIAVISPSGEITYGVLKEKVDATASFLIEQGLMLEEPVVVVAERSPWMLVAILGIMKAGGAYVPVEPDYPATRQQSIIDGSGSRFVLKTPGLQLNYTHPQSQVFDVEEIASAPAKYNLSFPKVQPSHLAYILFTSGSTGQPKGVMIEHGSVINYLRGFDKLAPVPSDLVGSSVCPFVFDVSVWEFFSVLCYGGTLHLLSPSAIYDTSWFADYIIQNHINSAYLAPGILEGLATDLAIREKCPLQRILVGVEPIPEKTLGKYLILNPEINIVNGYGPTEATISCTFYKFTHVVDPNRRTPIGTAIDGYEVWVVHEDFRKCQAGESGEILIGGKGLARGYFKDEELTQQKFIPHPFRRDSGERVFRTGDRARVLDDGNLLFEGRMDFQLKIRGYRIEPGDVEAHILKFGGIEECVVVGRESSAGVKYLVAYYATSAGKEISEDRLREFLASQLPDYMIPAVFVRLERLPRTSAGKIDRKVLPDPSQIVVTPSKTLRDSGEWLQKVREIWAEVLRVMPAPTDNFFVIGGDSIKAAQIMSRLAQQMGGDWPVSLLFSHPTPESLATILQKTSDIVQPAEPLPSASGNIFPLSFNQQRPILLNLLGGDSSVYNFSIALRFKGRLDKVVLHKALSDLVQRHDALRTTFAEIDGNPSQKIHKEGKVLLEEITVQPGADLESLLQQQAGTHFDLEVLPLFKVVLYHLTESSDVLQWVVHHSIADGWTMGLLFTELRTAYDAHSRQQTPVFATQPAGYPVFTLYERQKYQQGKFTQGLKYFKDLLRDAPMQLQLPSLKQRPMEFTFEGGSHFFYIPADLAAQIEAFAAAHSDSVFMLLMAAFGLALSRYTNTDDLVIGTMAANRTHPAFEHTAGFFSNTLLMRLSPSSEMTVEEYLYSIRSQATRSFAHPDLPLELLLQDLNPPRNLSFNPLFQVMLIYQNMPLEHLSLNGLESEELEVHTLKAKLDLTLTFDRTTEGIRGHAEYYKELYDENLISDFCHKMVLILQQITENPSLRIKDLQILSPGDFQFILEKAENKDHIDANITISDLFGRISSELPGKAAVLFGDSQMTYEQFCRDSDVLAAYLVEKEIKTFGLLSLRHPDTLVAMMAGLKAGAAWVPVSSGYPKERVKMIAEDAGFNIVLGVVRMQQLLPDDLAFQDIRQAIEEGLKFSSKTSRRPDLDDIAYILFTSGSTGKPKGVKISHRSLSNFVQSTIHLLQISNIDRVLQFADLSFDTCMEEIFPALCSGATLILRDEQMVEQLDSFWKKVDRWGITLLDLPTAFWGQLMTEAEFNPPEIPENLRMVIIGGEAARPDQVKTFQKLTGNRIQLVNTYGPTETTVVSTYYIFPSQFDLPYIPIGRPILNTGVWVVDEHLQPVIPGVEGELLVSGLCLAQGYVGNSNLTTERFLDWTRPDGQRARVYRTGDRVWMMPDGNVVYTGRLDKQLKIRGFRVEADEILHFIRRLPGIRDAVVDLWQQKLLTLWYVPHEKDLKINIEEFRKELSQWLPSYMIPVVWMKVDGIPLTRRGKTDFSKLPPPDLQQVTSEIIPPQTPLQQDLAHIWADVLGIPSVGINQNFFDLGGNSILAASLVTRMSKFMHTGISLRALFRNPTILALSDYLEKEGGKLKSREPIKLGHAPAGQIIPASPAQQRIWFLDQLEGANAAYNIPMEYLVKGNFDKVAFEKALQHIVDRHEALRSCIRQFKDAPVYFSEKKIIVKPQQVDLLSLAENEKEAELARFRKEFSLFIFDLAKAPLLKVALVHINSDTWALMFNFHHLIFDNWSAGIFIKELNEAYQHFRTGNSPIQDVPKYQYSDYIWWFNERWASGELKAGIEYWSNKLKGIPQVINLPLDFSRKTRQTFNGAEYRLEVPSALSKKLKGFSASQRVTLFLTLLAGFAALLQRYTAQDDIVIGCPSANRRHPDVQDIIGVFINNLPVRFSLGQPQSFIKMVKATAELWLEAEDYQEVPFEKMVEVLNLKRDLSVSPIFQVMFDFLNAHAFEPSFDGCKVSYNDPPHFVAKYDLSLIAAEFGGALHLTFEYNTDLFKYNTIRQMAHYYLRLLDLALQMPDKPVQQLELVALKSQEYILGKVNPEPSEFPQESVVELIEKTAATYPLKPAIETAERTLSYAALMHEVNRLAARMMEAGVSQGHRVAVMLRREWRLPVALLAIMRCGAAYIPLDPVYPRERIRHILGDAQPEFAFTEPEFASWFEDSGTTPLHFGEAELPLPGAWPSFNLRNPAYIIYTSGSTGKPKGVVIPMEALVNFLWAVKGLPGFSPDDRLLAVTTVSFDISGLELYLPLISGGTMVLATHEEAMDVHLLMKKLQEARITYMQATPVTWRMLSFAGWEGSTELKVLCGGEALQQDLGNYLVTRCREVWNMFGPTETTIWSSAHRVVFHPVPDRYEPIGRPLANNFFYVLDKFGQMVPEGVPGELFIGGKGVALGYYNNPELTRARFRPDPFTGAAGGTMYQTGDLVRLLPNGVFEYFGRLDNQVKIRGFRIELGEIEAVLADYPGIVQSVVVVREDIPNSPRLVAYYKREPDFLPDAAQIRNYLSDKLPDYMIPQAFVEVQEFPLTPNGKIDRKALPEPTGLSVQAQEVLESPRTATEQLLVDIWREILKIDAVGRNSDFFELGGHSLLAVSMMGKIEHHTGKRIPLAVLFTHSKLEELAAYVDHAGSADDWRSLVRIKPFGTKVPLFLIHGAGLNVMLYNSMVNNLSFDQPVYGLQAKGLSGEEVPLGTMEEIAAHYISEIKTVAPKGPYAFAGFSLGGIIAFEMARQLIQQGEEVPFVGMFDTVAFTSDKHLPKLKRYLRRIKIALMKILFVVWIFITDKESRQTGIFGKKIRSLRWKFRRLVYLFKAQKAYLQGDKDKLPEYLRDVHELNTRAMENYVLKPSPVAIDLFRALRQTFYIEEPLTYGWAKYALGGVNVHHIPGEHSTIFWPPQDKIIADIIQKRLDDLTLDHQKKQSYMD
ncbi:MAG: amino acid adenylation domain-containing protein [Bacteroidales bacterium]